MMKIASAVGGVVLALALSQAAAATDVTRVVAIVNEGVAFDRSVAAPIDTDATLNVLMAAQDAARSAGASELDIATGTTAELGLVEINVVTNGRNVQTGDSSSDVVQTGSAQSGDAIGGQVVSVVGSATVHQTNVSVGTRVHTGTSSGSNSG